MQQQSVKADDASPPATSGPGQTETQPNGPQMSGGSGGPGGVGGMGGADSTHPPHMPPRPGSGPGPGQGPPQAGMPMGPPMGMPPYRGMMPHYVSILRSLQPVEKEMVTEVGELFHEAVSNRAVAFSERVQLKQGPILGFCLSGFWYLYAIFDSRKKWECVSQADWLARLSRKAKPLTL